MTYDQWKTTDPADCAPVCDVCGGYLRTHLVEGRQCDACEDGALADEAMTEFYRWEPT